MFFECKLKLSHWFLLLLVSMITFLKSNDGILGLKVMFKLEHMIYLHNGSQCWPFQTDLTKWKATVAWSGNFKSYFQVPCFSGYYLKLLRVALLILNPVLLQSWRLSYLFLCVLRSADIPNGRFLFTCYFLQGRGENSFLLPLEGSQLLYFLISLYHFTHRALGRVIYHKFAWIISVLLTQKK